ncbi:MAG: endonuclease V [Candidatus Thermoplasmatota archaeon]
MDMNLYEYTYDLIRQIPAGMVSTYMGVAHALGDPLAARAVGYMMGQNPDPFNTPCYRIVNSNGGIGGYSRGVDEKIKRLINDGIIVEDGFILNFEKVYFDDFNTIYPLRKLREEQDKISRSVILYDEYEEIDTIAGVDVAYPSNAFDEACVGIVIMNYKTNRIIDERIEYSKVYFPYIPTYLSYRELPLIERIVRDLSYTPSIILVDGNGVLHPRHCGLASHLGVILNTLVIGVAKRPQIGTVNYDNTIVYNGKVCGSLYYPPGSDKPLYVSPGHKVSLNTSLRVVESMTTNHRIPEPLYRAHILAKKGLSERV